MTIHWFSDFVAGAILGTVIGVVVGKSFLREPAGVIFRPKMSQDLFTPANKSAILQAGSGNPLDFIWEYRSRNFFVKFS